MNQRIRINAKMIVAFQGGTHRLLKDGCIVIQGNEIIYVGSKFEGEVDQTIDLCDRLITPGFINTHAHIATSPLHKSFEEDVGDRFFYGSSLSDLIPALSEVTDQQAQRACVQYSLLELIRSGTTTLMEIGVFDNYDTDHLIEWVDRTGIRAYLADSFHAARWFTTESKRFVYEWDEQGGLNGLRRGIKLVEDLERKGNDRIKGFISPMHTDTSTERLLQQSKLAADDLNVPLTLHASQSVMEFQEIAKRYGKTPMEWLESIGFLSERLLIGHGLYTTGNSWVQCRGNDLEIMATNGVSVAHCPWVFARRGAYLESFSRYRKAGINMTLGTDTVPQSMLDSMRWAAIIGKIQDHGTEDTKAMDVFDAATISAARYLQRDDLGRIQAGAKADLLFWDTTTFSMTPMRDPIKSIVYNAEPTDIKEVMINGTWVMKDNKFLVDERLVIEELRQNVNRVWRNIGPGDWSGAGRSVDDLSPMTYPAFLE